MKKVLLILVLIINSINAQELDITPPLEFEPSAFTANKWHQYLGIGAIVAGLVAGATAKEGGKMHKIAGITGTALATGAVINGFWIHYDDLNLDFGVKDPDNIHILLGVGGAALYGMATGGALIKGISDENSKRHGLLGTIGTLAMITSIYITW